MTRRFPLRATTGRWGRGLVILVPYLWLAAFFLAPFAIVLKISLSQTVAAQPPYEPVIRSVRDIAAALRQFSLESYALLWSDPLYLASYLTSLRVAGVSTLLILAAGVPIALAVSRAPRRWRRVLFVLVVLPFLTSFLIRVYAWIAILQRDGILNQLLLALGVVDAPPIWLSTDTAVYIGIVYTYLPFMVLPVYAVLDRQDPSLLEAAADLGCPRWKAFWLVTLPLALRGVAAGSLLCFVPIMGEFVIPDLLGGSDNPMIGQTLWGEFFANRDWPMASAIAAVLLAVLLAPLILNQWLRTPRARS